MNRLYEKIKMYQPVNEQEEKDRLGMLRFIKTQQDVLLRSNEIAHFSASAWIVNKEHTKVLMVFHNLYQSWSWTGGHADGEEDLLAVAIREAKEETGITNVSPISDEIYSLEILTVNGHVKKGAYVSSHLHMNVTYLLEADESDPLVVKEDENSAVRWFTLDEAVEACSEPWMCVIYTKLNRKLAM